MSKLPSIEVYRPAGRRCGGHENKSDAATTAEEMEAGMSPRDDTATADNDPTMDTTRAPDTTREAPDTSLFEELVTLEDLLVLKTDALNMYDAVEHATAAQLKTLPEGEDKRKNEKLRKKMLGLIDNTIQTTTTLHGKFADADHLAHQAQARIDEANELQSILQEEQRRIEDQRRRLEEKGASFNRNSSSLLKSNAASA